MYMVYMLLLRAIYHLNLKIQGMTFNPNDSLENIHIKVPHPNSVVLTKSSN